MKRKQNNFCCLRASQWNMDVLVTSSFVTMQWYLMSAKLTFGNLVKPASSAADAHSNSQAWQMQPGHTGSSLKGMKREKKNHHPSPSNPQVIESPTWCTGWRCTCVLGECDMCRWNGIHLDYIVAVKFRVSVALIQKSGTHPVGITLYSLRLQKQKWLLRPYYTPLFN